MVVRISDKKQNYNNITKLLVKPKLNLPFKAGIHYNFLYQKGVSH